MSAYERVGEEGTYPVECRRLTRSSIRLRDCDIWGLDNPTPDTELVEGAEGLEIALLGSTAMAVI